MTRKAQHNCIHLASCAPRVVHMPRFGQSGSALQVLNLQVVSTPGAH